MINQSNFSLRNSILAVILSFAALSICALLISAKLYKDYVIELEKIAVNDLVHVKLTDIHSELSRYSTELGIAIQSEKKFRQALKNQDANLINRYLNDHFYQYYVTAGIIDLKKIFLLNVKHEYIHASSDGVDFTDIQNPICSDHAIFGESRKGAERLKPISAQCTFDGKSYYSVIVPIGTLKPKGFLQIITDPTFNIPSLSTAINSPVKVLYPDGSVAYTSSNWPSEQERNHYIFVNHKMHSQHDHVFYEIVVAKNFELLQKGFNNTTYTVLGISILVLSIGFAIAALISRRSLFSLREMSSAANHTSEGLYCVIPKSGFRELDSVIDAYNVMTEKVKNHNKRLEREIREATEQLRSALETVERRNSELESAIELADQANKTKSTFLANMSHELRTPLNAVIGYSEMLVEDLSDMGKAELAGDMKKINSAGKHLLEIVNNVLDLSKVEAGKIELDLSEFNLSDVVSQSIETVRPSALKKGILFNVNLPGNNLPIVSDAVRIKQILINLLNNAVKFTNDGNVTITVAESEYLSNAVYYIDIIDTGIGIKSEDIEKLFKPFQQVDDSATRRHDGTGLGLALSKQLIEGMGGNISVISEYNLGSTFSIRLPQTIHQWQMDEAANG